MSAASTLLSERARLAALERYAIVDTTPEEAFDELARLASMICETPIALISLVDASRQWFKSRVGLAATQTPRDQSFCAHAIQERNVFIVQDAQSDPRFAGNPLVIGEPNIRFYAGAQLTTPEGLNLGTLCVIDTKPRVLTDEQRTALRSLARQVMTQLELRRQIAVRDEVDQLKKDFISTVSHELRTPLTSIRGSLSLLAAGVMGELSDDARQMVGIAERNSVRLITLINDILDFDKLESGKMEMDLRPTSLLRVLERSIETISAFAAQEGVGIELRAASASVLGDESRLTQVVVNLLSNAVKYSDRGGVVTLRVDAYSTFVEVHVEDHGTGIAERAQARLFERFHQIDGGDARRKPGTGLGLAICKTIVEQHGGSIGVISRQGEGSTFWFRVLVAAEGTTALVRDYARSREIA